MLRNPFPQFILTIGRKNVRIHANPSWGHFLDVPLLQKPTYSQAVLVLIEQDNTDHPVTRLLDVISEWLNILAWQNRAYM